MDCLIYSKHSVSYSLSHTTNALINVCSWMITQRLLFKNELNSVIGFGFAHLEFDIYVWKKLLFLTMGKWFINLFFPMTSH